MQHPVHSVAPETPLASVHQLFVDEGIHGAPVVSDDGRLLGVVSSTDLITATLEQRESAAFSSDYARELVEFSGPDWSRGGPEDFQDRLAQLTAADVMTRGASTVDARSPIADVAALLHKERIHRVWVMDRDALVGVISTFDLLPIVVKAAS
jgi:CBS domain-containing protein